MERGSAGLGGGAGWPEAQGILGYAQELWATRLLAQQGRKHRSAAGHSRLPRLARGTVSKILRAVQPPKIRSYLERRGPDFETKMKQVLHGYKQVEIGHKVGVPSELNGRTTRSRGFKPWRTGLRTCPPFPASTRRWAAILSTFATARCPCGRALICGMARSWAWYATATAVRSSSNFCGWRTSIIRRGPAFATVLDHHSAHISRETRTFLATVPNRFEFIFTPTHGSWIESFFGKMAKTLRRGIRVSSQAELKIRIEMYLREVNEEPVVFRWTYKLETLSVV